jgi:hypothetical protein
VSDRVGAECDPAPVATTPTGLCGSCAHQRIVRSGRGSTFSMCERGLTDPAWAKYPPLPVLRCPGHEPRERADRPAGG